MRVIDGMHRIRAAELRGDTQIQALILDVDDQEAFRESVAANIAHGLPLSLSDRKAAAVRMMELYPHWSDRALGRACGLSGKTISAVRLRHELPGGMPERRVGLDGKTRPVDSAPGRLIARNLLNAHPDAPVRQIAREAGISPGTVRKVRDSMVAEAATTAGVRPVIAPRRERQASVPAGPVREPVSRFPRPEADPEHILNNLRQDPSLIYREQGRDLLRLLHRRPVLSLGQQILDAIPAHCVAAVAALSRYYAQEWLAFSGMLENRARNDAA